MQPTVWQGLRLRPPSFASLAAGTIQHTCFRCADRPSPAPARSCSAGLPAHPFRALAGTVASFVILTMLLNQLAIMLHINSWEQGLLAAAVLWLADTCLQTRCAPRLPRLPHCCTAPVV